MAAHDVDYESVCERLVLVSDRISTQVRTLAIGVLAILWALWTAESVAARNISAYVGWQVFGIALIAVLTLLSDFLQYVSGYLSTARLRRKMEAQNLNKASIDYSAPFYICQDIFFYTKQMLAATCTIWLVIVLGMILIRHGSDIRVSKPPEQQSTVMKAR